MSVKKLNFLVLFVYALLLLFISNRIYAFPSSLSLTKIFETDGIFTQVQIQSFIDGALFGSTDNLGYPIGYSHWVIPQFGIVDATIIWLLGNLTSITNYGLLTIAGILTLVLNLGSMYYLGFKINKNRVTAFSFGLIGLTTPFAINSSKQIIRRYIYPATEATLNGVNYQAAVGKISGGDTNDGKVWWDK